jgi:hypothetical protein
LYNKTLNFFFNQQLGLFSQKHRSLSTNIESLLLDYAKPGI